jgi:hypothetical protein
MNCQDKQNEFQTAFEIIKTQLEKEVATVATDTEKKSKELANSADNDNNIAEGVGMAAGTAIGGYFGGPAGAAVGATIGKEVGKLFDVEITNQEVVLKFDLPEITMKDEEIKLDLPEVTMKDNDIIFSSIEIVMVDRVIGQNPNVVCTTPTFEKPIPECKVYYTDIIISVPEPREKEIRIVLSVPEITMKTQSAIISVPQFTMKTQEVKFNIPSITVRSKEDIGNNLTEKAKELVADSEKNINEKKSIVKTAIKMDVIPKATEMFNCFKDSILFEKNIVFSNFDPAINTLNETLKTLKVKNVPESDNDYIKVATQLNLLISQRDGALKGFETALEKLDSDMKKSLESLINL